MTALMLRSWVMMTLSMMPERAIHFHIHRITLSLLFLELIKMSHGINISKATVTKHKFFFS